MVGGRSRGGRWRLEDKKVVVRDEEENNDIYDRVARTDVTLRGKRPKSTGACPKLGHPETLRSCASP